MKEFIGDVMNRQGESSHGPEGQDQSPARSEPTQQDRVSGGGISDDWDSDSYFKQYCEKV